MIAPVDGLPAGVRVGPHLFSVEWSRTPVLEEVQRTQSDRYAHTDFDKLEICIDDRVPTSRRKEILLHELLHCLFWVYSVAVPVDLHEGDKKDGMPNEEEKFIQQTTAPLMLLWHSNRETMDWIFSEEETADAD